MKTVKQLQTRKLGWNCFYTISRPLLGIFQITLESYLYHIVKTVQFCDGGNNWQNWTEYNSDTWAYDYIAVGDKEAKKSQDTSRGIGVLTSAIISNPFKAAGQGEPVMIDLHNFVVLSCQI